MIKTYVFSVVELEAAELVLTNGRLRVSQLLCLLALLLLTVGF